MHDSNRESANSISKNMQFDYWTYMTSIHFNKKPVEDTTVNYRQGDLLNMGQIESAVRTKNRNTFRRISLATLPKN